MPAGRVLVLLLLAATVLYVGSDRLLRNSTAFWRFCARYSNSTHGRPLEIEASLALLEPGTLDLAVLGDSIAQSDLSVPRLAQGLGMATDRVLDLHLPAGSPVELAMMAPELVRALPRVVVLLAPVWILYETTEADDMRFYSPSMAPRLFSTREILADHTAHVSNALASTHVVVRHRDRLRRAIGAAATGRSPDSDLPDDLAHSPNAQPEAAAPSIGRRQPICPNPQTRAIAVLAERLQARGTSFTVVSTPSLDERGHRPFLLDTLDACLASMAAESGFLHIPSTEFHQPEAGEFSDPSHMNLVGRMRFTDELTRRIAPTLPPPDGG